MNDMQIGKMYLVKDWFWYMFPTKELAMGMWSGRNEALAGAYQYAKWLSERCNGNVPVVEKNTCFVLLEQSNDYFKILDSNGNVGWIRCLTFSKYFKILNETKNNL